MRETALQTPPAENKEGMKVIQVQQQGFYCSPWRRPVSLKPVEDHKEADIHTGAHRLLQAGAVSSSWSVSHGKDPHQSTS